MWGTAGICLKDSEINRIDAYVGTIVKLADTTITECKSQTGFVTAIMHPIIST